MLIDVLFISIAHGFLFESVINLLYFQQLRDVLNIILPIDTQYSRSCLISAAEDDFELFTTSIKYLTADRLLWNSTLLQARGHTFNNYTQLGRVRTALSRVR